jgi:hypothetical protein
LADSGLVSGVIPHVGGSHPSSAVPLLVDQQSRDSASFDGNCALCSHDIPEFRPSMFNICNLLVLLTIIVLQFFTISPCLHAYGVYHGRDVDKLLSTH